MNTATSARNLKPTPPKPKRTKEGDTERWVLPDGRKHRLDGPAVVSYTRSRNRLQREWWVEGVRHRTDGPALDLQTGDGSTVKEWWIEGKQHRADGPARESESRDSTQKEWWIDGKRHRTDGPAWEETTARAEFTQWWVEGKHHRVDGPAVLTVSGGKPVFQQWWVEGKRHRLDGPAQESWDSWGEGAYAYEWRYEGERHRGDHYPAQLTESGTRKWWWHDEPLATRVAGEPDLTADEWEALIVDADPECDHPEFWR